MDPKYTIIIPAAGLGKRMKIYGPKPLIKINKKHSILTRQLKHINNCFKNCEIIIICGKDVELIEKEVGNKKNNNKFIYNDAAENTNVLYSIGMGLQHATTEKVVVIYGDLIFNKYCIAGKFEESSIITCDGMKSEEVGCIINNSRLENIFYQLPAKWAQIAYFCQRELKMLQDITSNKQNSNWFGFEAINKIIDKGGEFLVQSPKNARAMDIDSSYDLKKYENLEQKI